MGRCDVRCYDARRLECHCICGGRNHGAGLERALTNTAELVAQHAELIKRMREMGGDEVLVQPELPGQTVQCTVSAW